jgi:hypothetical protein
MGDATGAGPDVGEGDLTMYRPRPEGGLEAAPGGRGDYRATLRSRRWDAAPLENPEVEPTDPRIAVSFIAGLSALTLVLIVAGYASGFWG